MEEIWKDIPEFNGLYQVSSFGRFRGVTRVVQFGNQRRTVVGKILRAFPKKEGYLKISFLKNTRYAHRVVAEVFIDNPNDLKQVNHKNGNKTDNRVENLEWISSSDNHKHAYSVLGRKCYAAGKFGAESKRSKPILQYSIIGSFVKEFSCAAEASREVGIGESNIRQCVRGVTKTAKGFIWKSKTSSDFQKYI